MAKQKKDEKQKLIKERGWLIEEMPELEGILRGSVLTYFLPCGKKGCKCKRDKDSLHGPYYYISVSEKGKTKMYLLGRKRKEAVYAVARYNDMMKRIYRICEINLKLLLAQKEEDEKKEKEKE